MAAGGEGPSKEATQEEELPDEDEEPASQVYLSARGPQCDNTSSLAGPAPSVAGSAPGQTVGQVCHTGSCCLALPCIAPQAMTSTLPSLPTAAAAATPRGYPHLARQAAALQRGLGR